MIPFISRHIPTPAQVATVRERFGEMEPAEIAPVFEPGRVVAQVVRALPDHGHPACGCWDGQSVCDFGAHYRPYLHEGRLVVAGVFPGWALLELLRAEVTVVEFVNAPSARERGAFVCRGAYVHTLESSEWIACPVPVEDQEPSVAGTGARQEARP